MKTKFLIITIITSFLFTSCNIGNTEPSQKKQVENRIHQLANEYALNKDSVEGYELKYLKIIPRYDISNIYEKYNDSIDLIINKCNKVRKNKSSIFYNDLSNVKVNNLTTILYVLKENRFSDKLCKEDIDLLNRIYTLRLNVAKEFNKSPDNINDYHCIWVYTYTKDGYKQVDKSDLYIPIMALDSLQESDSLNLSIITKKEFKDEDFNMSIDEIIDKNDKYTYDVFPANIDYMVLCVSIDTFNELFDICKKILEENGVL